HGARFLDQPALSLPSHSRRLVGGALAAQGGAREGRRRARAAADLGGRRARASRRARGRRALAEGPGPRARRRQCRVAGRLGVRPRARNDDARRRLVQALRPRGGLREARARVPRLGSGAHRADQARPDDPLPEVLNGDSHHFIVVVHLVDGTYELFRHFYGLRRFNKGKDAPLGAVAGVLHTVLQMIEKGATHVGVATDHVIESFRNRLWPGYKTSEGMEPALLAQFHPLEEALAAMGVAVWPMVELEADDAHTATPIAAS